VLVTDGQVGNEDQILKHLGQRVKGLRIFTLGIDRAVNAAFLRRLADLGGGRSEVVESEDRLDEVMDMLHRHIGTPVLTELRLEPAGLKFLPDSVVPGRLPDLFAGTPLLISGRYRGDADGAIALQARDAAGQMWSVEVRGRRVDNPALTTVWARGRLREMEDRYVIGTGDPTALEREIVATSLRFGVLCRFTAFVAVDRSEVVNPGGQVHGVVQPVEQPSGWETQTLCGAASSALRSLGRAKRKQARGAKPCAPPSASRALPPAAAGGTAESEVESVDSMLMEFNDEESAEALDDEMEDTCTIYRSPTLATPSGPSLIRRLLSLFFGRKGRKNARQASVDRRSNRQRALDLLQSLQGSLVADASARLTVLRSLVAKLEELFQNLVVAGDRDPSVKALGEAMLRLHTLLAENQPTETDILDVWLRIKNALRSWLELTPDSGPRREGFWK
jgi:hypothetical protein